MFFEVHAANGSGGRAKKKRPCVPAGNWRSHHAESHLDASCPCLLPSPNPRGHWRGTWAASFCGTRSLGERDSGRLLQLTAPRREEAATVVCSLPRVHDKCSRLDVVVLTCRAVIGQWARRGAVVETCRVGETSCVRKVCGETASGLSWSWLFSPRHHGRALAVAILCPPSPCARRA